MDMFDYAVCCSIRASRCVSAMLRNFFGVASPRSLLVSDRGDHREGNCETP